MNKILNIFKYYLLLLIGLGVTSWIVYSRFIRERTIRDIPDMLFTEYRFWILLYICGIYLYVVKNLIKPKEPNSVVKELITIIYIPLKTLDCYIKYNKKIKPYYYKYMCKYVQYSVDKTQYKQTKLVIFCLQIIPRFILISFLLLDTFYFHKLELFYKVILIGIIPFIVRYIKYSLKDIYEKWIEELEIQYSGVKIFEKGFEYEEDNNNNVHAKYHNKRVTIKEYIEIKFENFLEYHTDKVDYEYISYAYPQREILNQYLMNKYNTTKIIFTSEDIEILRQLYEDLMPSIIYLKYVLFELNIITASKLIKWSRIIIFSLYFISWFFILVVCYIHKPVELMMGKYYISNFLSYLLEYRDIILNDQEYSKNINVITIEVLENIFEKVLETIKRYIEKLTS